MDIAYLTNFIIDPNAPVAKHQTGHGGRCAYMVKGLQTVARSLQVCTVEPPAIAFKFKLKSKYYRTFSQQVYHPWAEPAVSRYYADRFSQWLARTNVDVVLSPDINLISFLECDRPLVLWVDTLYAGLIDFYPDYTRLCRQTQEHLQLLDRQTLDRCDLLLFSSEWTARTAIEQYNTDANKIKIVPFGANIDSDRSLEEIQTAIAAKPQQPCKLLFIGVDWERKGGNIAVAIARELNARGLETEIAIVGCQPPTPLPEFAKLHGFIDKSTPAGQQKLARLLNESHFLIVPSRSECFGHVFCEANAFGVPCLSTDVGGISSVIRDDVNGKTFAIDAPTSDYCNYVCRKMEQPQEYDRLAISAFQEYRNRLNWKVASQQVAKWLDRLQI